MAHLLKFANTSHLALLCSYLSIFLLLISSIKSQQPPVTSPSRLSTDPGYYYNLCAPSKCNNISLSYPFSLPFPCHPTGIIPSCPNNETLKFINPGAIETFRVLSMDLTADPTISLLVASDSLFNCSVHVSFPYYPRYTELFTLSSDYRFGTHLNCTAPIPHPDKIRDLQNASCLGCNNPTNNVCYYAPGVVATVATCVIFRVFTYGGSFNATAVKDLRAFLRSGFKLIYVKRSECRGCEASGGRCGTQPISGSFVCFCPSSVHPMNCSDGMQVNLSTWVNEQGGGSGLTKAAVVGMSSASALFLIIAVVLVVILVHRRKKRIQFYKETISSISPTRYSYSQLKKLTNNFSLKLGEGGFGSVYKGTIHRSGAEVAVAVKMLRKSQQTQKQFINEVATIGSVHHHNLVAMLGYCVDGNDHALVYEFMENGSLDKYIYRTNKEKDGVEDESKLDYKKLSHKQLFNIALETARGILYLHQGCVNKILHCDIKPPNVLLDSNFTAKVADFGLARMIEKDHSHVSLTGAQGTPGYAAPEIWLNTFGSVITDKSDVYSYGMLLLEMVGRRKNYDPEAGNSSQVYFPEWLYNKVERDEFPSLMRGGEKGSSFEIVGDKEDQTTVQRMCLVGLWCIQHIPSNRPNMDEVVQMLEGHVEIGIPPSPFPQNILKSQESSSQEALSSL